MALLPRRSAVPDIWSDVEELPAFCTVVVWSVTPLVVLAFTEPYLIEDVVMLIARSVWRVTPLAVEEVLVLPPIS